MSQSQPVVQSDPVTDLAVLLVKVALLVVVALVALPLVLPLLTMAVLPLSAATKTRFWTVPRG